MDISAVDITWACAPHRARTMSAGVASWAGAASACAAAGFVAFAPDLFDGPTATTIEGAEQLMEASDEARSRAIAEAAVAYLRAQPGAQAGPLDAVGFSMGRAGPAR